MPLGSFGVVGQTEGVKEEEKVAESSYSKAEPLGSRGGTSPPPAGEVGQDISEMALQTRQA